jgi:hypothetical protein
MEHTVSGVDKMHISLMKLTLGVCQPKQDCSGCATDGIRDEWWMGLNVSDIHTLQLFCSD